MNEDKKFMKLALNLARKYEGFTSPNPSVGALIVKEGKIISKGFHRGPGTLHAEAYAIKKAGPDCRDSTLYVSLEPCNHYGRTPPCTLEIIKSGIKRVVYGTEDPNPHVKGKGAEFLRKKRIEVIKENLNGEVDEFYRPYFKFVKQNVPFVTLKLSLTLDSRITLKKGERHTLSSEKALSFSHFLRRSSDGILVGAGTLKVDNPLLSVRDKRGRVVKKIKRIILDGDLCLSPRLKIFEKIEDGEIIIFTCEKKKEKKIKELERRGCTVIPVSRVEGLCKVDEVLSHLGRMGVMNLLVEGGARVFSSFIEKNAFDRLVMIYSPLFAGKDGIGPGEFIKSSSKRFKVKKVKMLGDSIAIIMEA